MLMTQADADAIETLRMTYVSRELLLIRAKVGDLHSYLTKDGMTAAVIAEALTHLKSLEQEVAHLTDTLLRD